MKILGLYKAKFTLRNIANSLGLSQSHLSNIIAGRRKMPTNLKGKLDNIELQMINDVVSDFEARVPRQTVNYLLSEDLPMELLRERQELLKSIISKLKLLESKTHGHQYFKASYETVENFKRLEH